MGGEKVQIVWFHLPLKSYSHKRCLIVRNQSVSIAIKAKNWNVIAKIIPKIIFLARNKNMEIKCQLHFWGNRSNARKCFM